MRYGLVGIKRGVGGPILRVGGGKMVLGFGGLAHERVDRYYQLL
jgi:hypothetical protein